MDHLDSSPITFQQWLDGDAGSLWEGQNQRGPPRSGFAGDTRKNTRQGKPRTMRGQLATVTHGATFFGAT
eukprot:1565355-Lingulodinium_polyedra.AAC.1